MIIGEVSGRSVDQRSLLGGEDSRAGWYPFICSGFKPKCFHFFINDYLVPIWFRRQINVIKTFNAAAMCQCEPQMAL